MRITTSYIIFALLVFFQLSLATAQEEKTYLPNPFDELMQKLNATGTLEGLVYADFNANGTRDAGEPGLENVRVIIVNSLGNGQTAPTNADGIWTAEVIEGNATLIMDISSLPPGFVQTEGTDPSTELVIADTTVQAQTKGFAFEGDASGHLYFDVNGNGIQDLPEPDMPDVDVVVTDQYGNTQTVATNLDGDWQATVLFGPVEVSVNESDPDFPIGSFQTEGSNPSFHIIPSGSVTFTENDGFFESGVLSGIIYFDDNVNGSFDLGEPGLDNIPVTVTTSLGDILTVVSDASGAWSLRVPEGTTTSFIDESVSNFPPGAIQTDGDNPTVTEVVNGQTFQEFDGFVGTGILRGHLYFDDNGNFTQDVDEPDMPNVEVEIIDSFGDATTLVTDANGDWEIEVPSGNTTSDINQLDPDFPQGATQTEGTDPTLTQVNAGSDTVSDNDGFFDANSELEGTLLGHLYLDSNGNGTQDAGEPDLPNIDVQITDTFGNVTVLETDINGDWSISVPSGNTTSDILQSDPDFPVGAIQTEGTDPTITFVPVDATVFSEDDGFFINDPELTGILEGHLYFDLNANGTQDAGEPDMPNVDVEIIDSFGDITILETDALGDWSIEVPAGITISNIDQLDPDFPAGAVQTEGLDPSTTLVVANDTTLSDIDGFFVPDASIEGTLLGHLYIDSNGNGNQEITEPDLPNVDVEITDVFNNVITVTTDANGDWSIEVPAGNAISEIDQLDPDFPVGVLQTEGTNPTTTLVPQNETILSDNDGFFVLDPSLTGNLTGHLYIDSNGNGNQDVGEPDLNDIEVIITDEFGVSTSVITDTNGNWIVEVPAGNVQSDINQQDPDFPNSAIQTEGSDPTTTFVAVGSTTFSEDDGFFVPDPSLTGILTGHLYFDDNGNGTQDAGEPDMPNVDVEIIDALNNVTILSTDANGDWSIEVPAGNAVSNIDQQDPDFPTGSIQTEGGDPTTTFVVADVSTLSDNDGFFAQDPSITGILSGHLYFDNNSNGIQDTNEPDMPNVLVQVVDGNNISQNLITDINGDWSAQVAEGSVTSTIDETDLNFPLGATQTQGTNPTTTLVNAGDQIDEEPDGYFTSNQTGFLSGIVYEDSNENGLQDSGEPGLEGVEIEIVDSSGSSDKITTDALGQWSISVPIGNTTSTIDTAGASFPIGAVQTQGTNPTTTFVGSNSNVFEVPDGYFISNSNLGRLIGHLYVDTNGNGNQDSGEPDLSNIEIQITDALGVVSFVETNADGDWSIEVPEGNTISDINRDDPDFPANSIQTEGTDPTTTQVIFNEIVFSENDGFFIQDPSLTGLLSGHLYLDNNNNGIQDASEPNLPDVFVQVTDGANITQNLITDANGDWTAQVIEGAVTSTIDENDPNFPTGAIQTQGDNPTTTQINSGDVVNEEPDGFFDQNQSGILTGIVYEDQNNNGVQDSGEPGIADVEIQIEESDGSITVLSTDTSGQWSATVSIGNTTSTINTDDPNFPESAIQTQGTNPTTTFVIPDIETFEEPDGFFVEETDGILTGRLYFDDNGNSVQDADEEGIPDITIFITDFEGTNFEVQTDSNGDWSIEVKAGETLSKIDTDDSDFPLNVIQTEGTDPTTTLVLPGETVISDADGFFFEETEGTLTGRLYFDDNGNGSQDTGEEGISNVSIFITDSAGEEFEIQTNINGNWSIDVIPGETQSKINLDDADFPSNVIQTEGTDPTTSLVVIGEMITSDVDGFFIDDVEVFNAVGSQGNELNRFFIKGIENYPDNSVQIFNRQGVKVYDVKGYNNNNIRFDGMSDGNITLQKSKRLPTGTYFYILNYINRVGEAISKKGYLHLN